MTTPKISITSLADLVVTLPHQLGYRPEDSLVIALLGQRTRGGSAQPSRHITMKCRIDLPADAQSRAEIVGVLTDVVRREGPTGAFLIAYEDAHGAEPDATQTLCAVSRMCESQGVGVGGVVRVRDNRWLEVDSDGGVWRTLPAVEDVRAVADLVYRGMQPGPSRSELTARVWGKFDADQVLLLAELDSYADRFLEALHSTADGPMVSQPRFVERGARAWRRLLDTTPGAPAVRDLPAAVVAQGLAMLWDRDFRDALISWLAPGQLGPGMLPTAVWAALVRHLPLSRLPDSRPLDRLVEICGLVPDEVAAPVLSVTGQCAWILNNGTIANIAIERALESQPDYTLAQLVDQLLRHGVRPPGGPFATAA